MEDEPVEIPPEALAFYRKAARRWLDDLAVSDPAEYHRLFSTRPEGDVDSATRDEAAAE